MRSIACLLALLSPLPAPLHADEPDAVALRTEAARSLFLAGKAAYEHGNYEQALREFSEGYKLSPRPEFLLNIAQSYNKLGQRDQAISYYESYLAVDSTSPFADIARLNLEELQRARAAARAATANPATANQATATPATATPANATPAIHAAPPRRSKRWHLAWALPAAAIVITGAALGIYFGTRGPACDPRNCIDASHAP